MEDYCCMQTIKQVSFSYAILGGLFEFFLFFLELRFTENVKTTTES